MTHNRILIFSTDDHLFPAGGAEQAFGNITERLSHIEFDLICARLRKGVPKEEVVKNVHIHRIGFGVPKLDGVLLALFGHIYARRLMKHHSYDLIWSIMASYGAFAAVRVKKKTKLPFLLTLQEGDSFEYIYRRVRFVWRQFRAIFCKADGVQAISHFLLKWGSDMGYTGAHGMVIPNGVAIDAFTQAYSDEELRTTRATFGFPDDALILMTSSRLEKKNGIKDVVDALALLPPHVCFVVCGSGSLESTIRAQVARRGLTDRVHFMGFVEPEKLPRIMKACDVFIRPSLTEGLGNAFLEAMAARIPVIGTNAGGIPDFLHEGETGFVVEIENPESIKDAVERITALTNEKRTTLLDTAAHMVKETYNWEKVASDMERLFETLTLSRPTALVLDGNLKSALAVVRSLGEKGVPVIVGAPRTTGMALHSKYTKKRFVYPSPYTDREGFVAALTSRARECGDKPVVYALSDATYLSLYAHREELQEQMTLVFPSETSVGIAFDKAATYSLANVSQVPTIPTHSPELYEEVNRLSTSLSYPVVLKARKSVTWNGGVGIFGSASFVMNADELVHKFREVKEQIGESPLIQKLVYGEEYGVEVLAHEGKVFARTVHHRLRSLSPTGGASVLKETLGESDLTQTLSELADRLIAGLSWSGPLMVEFKVDGDTRTPYLMEVNGRFWGSLPLSVFAGVDMPYLYYEYARTKSVPEDVSNARGGVASNHFLGNVRNLIDALLKRDPMRPFLYPRRTVALLDFFARPKGTKSDVWSWRDPKPAFFEISDMLNKHTWTPKNKERT